MTDTELQRLKCYIVSKQHELILRGQYGLECNVSELKSEIKQALSIYNWYTICPTEQCDIADFIKTKINTCKLPIVPCNSTVTLNCSAIYLIDNTASNTPCNSITIQ